MPKQYMCQVLVEIPDEEHATWDCGCDETFGVGFFHDPERGIYVTTITPVDLSPEWTEKIKHKIFTEEGGI